MKLQQLPIYSVYVLAAANADHLFKQHGVGVLKEPKKRVTIVR